MLDRLNAKPGGTVDLFLFERNILGELEDLYSVGLVYIYPNNPEISNANTILSSLYGYSTSPSHRDRLFDNSLNFISKGVSVGDYIEVMSGDNAGKYKVSAVGENNLVIDGAFSYLEGNIQYRVLRILAVLAPTKIGIGTYKVSWSIPSDAPGGYYYDLWTGVQKGIGVTPKNRYQYFYVDKMHSAYMSGENPSVVGRYYARPGSTLILDAMFRDSGTFAPVDPYSISSVRLYRKNASVGPVADIVTSLFGAVPGVDRSIFTDQSIDFSSLSASGNLRKYDTLRIESPSWLAGSYRIDSVDMVTDPTGHTLRLIDFVPAGPAITDINYAIGQYVDVLACGAEITKVDVGRYSVEFPVPIDFLSEQYWDEWKYQPDSSLTQASVTYNYDDASELPVSNADLIEVDETLDVARLKDLGVGVYSKVKPWVKIDDLSLADGLYLMQNIASGYGLGNEGSVEYSFLVNDIPVVFNNENGWIENDGFFGSPDPMWNQVDMAFKMAENLIDIKRGVVGAWYGATPHYSGNQASFNGIDNYALIASPNGSVISGGFTFCFKFKTSEASAQVLFMKATSAATKSGVGYVCELAADGDLVFSFKGGSRPGEWTSARAELGLNDGEEHHVVVSVSNLKDGPGDVSIAVDGTVVTFVSLGGLHDDFIANDYPLVIGCDYNGGVYGQRFFNGLMSGFAMIRTGSIVESDLRRLYAAHTNNLHSSSAEALVNYLPYLIANDSDKIGVYAHLVSNGSQKVELSQTIVGWIRKVGLPVSRHVGDVYVGTVTVMSIPGVVDMCRVVGRIIGLNGVPKSGVTVCAHITGKQSVAGNAMYGGAVEALTDANGYYSMVLPQGVVCTVSIPEINFYKSVTVPYATVSGMEAL